MSIDQYPPDGDPNYYEDSDDSETECPINNQDRKFWGVMGLSYVCSSIAIVGTWSQRMSPWLIWPLLVASIALIALAPRYLRRR